MSLGDIANVTDMKGSDLCPVAPAKRARLSLCGQDCRACQVMSSYYCYCYCYTATTTTTATTIAITTTATTTTTTTVTATLVSYRVW